MVVTNPIRNLSALRRDLEADRDALWERIRELCGFDLNPNPPKGVVEMAEQGIRDPEERLSR